MVGFALVLMCLGVSDPTPDVDLAFKTSNLAGWEGSGFENLPEPGLQSGSTSMFASSQKAPKDGRALLHAAVPIPYGVKEIHCFAAAFRSAPGKPDGLLDVLMYAAGKRLITKRVRIDQGWQATDHLLGPKDNHLQEYSWNVEAYGGKTVRLALLDDDPRSDCFIICSGFQMLADDRALDRTFEKEVHQFERDHHLKPMRRYESQHYLAMSNCDSSFNDLRLGNCELLYTSFFQYFRGKGFKIHEPVGKLHAVVFQSQASFHDYLGTKIPQVTGFYMPETNRLAMYDFGTNQEFVVSKRKSEEQSQRIVTEDKRLQFLDSVSQKFDVFRRGQNISTIMHEASHQLSMNCGLLNRSGDKPMWLVEGLACYCEPTKQGTWQGIGEPNPDRLTVLSKGLASKTGLIPLTTMIASDKWLNLKGEASSALLGYGQSWALFRWLMEEKTAKFREYLEVLSKRNTPEHRLADFQHAFGRDLKAVQAQYENYVKQLVQRYPQAQR